jgi:general secretion pathway protein I
VRSPERAPHARSRAAGPVASAPSPSPVRADATRRGHGGAGFTLLEVLVAVAILGIALVSLLGLHVKNLALVDRDRRVTEATLLAQARMTEIETGPPPELGLTRGDFQERYPDRYPDLGWEEEVLPPPVPFVPNIREVHVRVFRGDGETPRDDDVSLVYFLRIR